MIVLRKLFARRDYKGLNELEAVELKNKRTDIAKDLLNKRSKIKADRASYDLHAKGTLAGEALEKSLRSNQEALNSNYNSALSESKMMADKARNKIIENSADTRLGKTNSMATRGLVKKKGLKLSRNQKLGAAALGTAAVIGAGTYAYKKHKKSKEEKK